MNHQLQDLKNECVSEQSNHMVCRFIKVREWGLAVGGTDLRGPFLMTDP